MQRLTPVLCSPAGARPHPAQHWQEVRVEPRTSDTERAVPAGPWAQRGPHSSFPHAQLHSSHTPITPTAFLPCLLVLSVCASRRHHPILSLKAVMEPPQGLGATSVGPMCDFSSAGDVHCAQLILKAHWAEGPQGTVHSLLKCFRWNPGQEGVARGLPEVQLELAPRGFVGLCGAGERTELLQLPGCIDVRLRL